MAVEAGAGTLVVESLKDVAIDLAKEEAGGRVSYALRAVVAEGVEMLGLHHNRRATTERPA